jgi:hypothetical protein
VQVAGWKSGFTVVVVVELALVVVVTLARVVVVVFAPVVVVAFAAVVVVAFAAAPVVVVTSAPVVVVTSMLVVVVTSALVLTSAPEPHAARRPAHAAIETNSAVLDTRSPPAFCPIGHPATTRSGSMIATAAADGRATRRRNLHPWVWAPQRASLATDRGAPSLDRQGHRSS